jgi:hypothetical protein
MNSLETGTMTTDQRRKVTWLMPASIAVASIHVAQILFLLVICRWITPRWLCQYDHLIAPHPHAESFRLACAASYFLGSWAGLALACLLAAGIAAVDLAVWRLAEPRRRWLPAGLSLLLALLILGAQTCLLYGLGGFSVQLHEDAKEMKQAEEMR